jgi:hypothetical protein
LFVVAGGGLFVVVVVGFVAVPLAAGFEEGKTLSDIFLFLFLFLFWPSKSCVRIVKGENEERGCKGKRG